MAPAWLDNLAALAIESALAPLAGLDPAFRARARTVAGRQLALTLDPAGVRVTLAFGAHGIDVNPGHTPDAEARVRLDPVAFGRLLTAGAAGSGVGIDGDSDFAATVLELLRGLRPDALKPLRRLLGDEYAFVLEESARRAGDGLRRGADRGLTVARDRLTAEDGPFPGRAEMTEFLDEVDAVRLAADRLEARVMRLTVRRGGQP